MRLGTLLHRAIEVLGNLEAAQRWFQSPRGELGGDTPLRHCDTDLGRQEVERILGRISDGVFS